MEGCLGILLSTILIETSFSEARGRICRPFGTIGCPDEWDTAPMDGLMPCRYLRQWATAPLLHENTGQMSGVSGIYDIIEQITLHDQREEFPKKVFII